ncbi:acyl-CoA dehydrogenase/oxidase C-terminal [Neolentinus lepideus HHB14362 ss-1]|uniref:Acyl-CoA dehydrogenase/oxidase C-terminal n=1 Tax=Neolentinus lepideus HHB14362 ss-1 TaxID=1314782 RepID=A0A165PUY2_9AGAM|nr:acyl-CoA dehydrogenase/oxidase C-terminal [Neolentinus lepideus HHB14362 ss-1]
METTAEVAPDGGGFVINGAKAGISNAPVAVVFIFWPRCKWNGKVRGFVVEKIITLHSFQSYIMTMMRAQGAHGLSATAIKNKLALRTSLTGSVFLDNVKVSQEALLSGTKDLGYGISWGVIIALEDCIARTREYALERHQFGRPLASFQLIQKKLVDPQTKVQVVFMSYNALLVGRVKDAGKVAPEMISLVKLNNCGKALEHARRVLDILGGNAYHVGNEGTHDIHALIPGKAMMGIQAFAN